MSNYGQQPPNPYQQPYGQSPYQQGQPPQGPWDPRDPQGPHNPQQGPPPWAGQVARGQ